MITSTKNNPKVSAILSDYQTENKEEIILFAGRWARQFSKNLPKSNSEFKKASDYINGKIDLLKIKHRAEGNMKS